MCGVLCPTEAYEHCPAPTASPFSSCHSRCSLRQARLRYWVALPAAAVPPVPLRTVASPWCEQCGRCMWLALDVVLHRQRTVGWFDRGILATHVCQEEVVEFIDPFQILRLVGDEFEALRIARDRE